ncbi:MAG: BON domain-containing protein [Burkholderiales bacterium]|nr:BON domain-containing protein [Burkholderiales bacterium]
MDRLALAVLLAASLLLSGCPAVMVTGAGAGVVAAEDRRTVGTLTEDQGIEFRTSSRVGERHTDRLHLNVTSYNRMVLLTGEVPSEQVRRDIERIARSVDNVRGVTNELMIGPPSSLSARANDTYITSKIKTRFVDAQRFNALHVKVVTENQVAYLLGLVKRQEAKDAIEIARTTEGVKKVVTVFEYLD